MKKTPLLQYLNSLSTGQQEDFAKRCGTTVGYIRKQISARKNFGETLSIAFERESSGAVRCADINPAFAKILRQSGYHKKAA